MKHGFYASADRKRSHALVVVIVRDRGGGAGSGGHWRNMNNDTNDTNDTISRAAAIRLLTERVSARNGLAEMNKRLGNVREEERNRSIAINIRDAMEEISELPAINPGTEIVAGGNQPEEHRQFAMVFADSPKMVATMRHRGPTFRAGAKAEARRLAEKCPGRRFYVACFDYSVISGVTEKELEATIPF